MQIKVKTSTIILAVLALAVVLIVVLLPKKSSENPAAVSAPINSGVQQIDVAVLDQGYSPSVVKLKANMPAQINFVGKSYGCAGAVISKDFWSGIKVVPVGKELAVTFTPTKPGTYRYTCSMGMYSGTIVVES